MTKVLKHFVLTRPMDEDLMKRLASTHGLYGMTHVKLLPSMQEIAVEYDASRLTPEQVSAALLRAGIPAEPKV